MVSHLKQLTIMSHSVLEPDTGGATQNIGQQMKHLIQGLTFLLPVTELNGGEEVDGESLKIVNNHVTFCIRARHWWSYPKHWLVDEAFNKNL